MTPDPTDDGAPEPTASEPVRQRTLWSRIPRHLFGGRVRTVTAALIVLFLATLMLYSQQSAYYEALDEASHTTAPPVHTDAPSDDDAVTTPAVTRSVTPTSTSEPTITTTSSVPPEAPDSEVEPTTPTTSAGTADTSEASPTTVVPTTTSLSDR
ncbi:hypothetical protein ACFWB0_17940 [Rhodococcus sp. NPDC060086]|uniref:hypothetical protein n=1 Tax=unclassified Rhodococcus (in: high G+C Gram-positive bacteria) TaxID=192944 RepID=UPI00365B72C4